MTEKAAPLTTLSQSKKFEAAAPELECDDDPDHFDKKDATIVKHKPVEPKSKDSSAT